MCSPPGGLSGFEERLMKWNDGRLIAVCCLLAGAMLLGPGTQKAQAQWGFGWGWGGFGGFNYVASPTDFLNQQARLNASRAGPPVSNRPYAGSPNAYFNRVRDNGFVPHYDVQRRRPPGERPRPPASLGDQAAAQPQPASSYPQPIIPLASFFDASRSLVWPSEAPVAGELKAKREVSDQSSLAVLDETKQQGIASIASVTDARQKLLDYGRPALQEVRAQATPRVADTFHLFLLSLYESLAQAANPTDASLRPPPAP
jgi:hypothetical protein